MRSPRSGRPLNWEWRGGTVQHVFIPDTLLGGDRSLCHLRVPWPDDAVERYKKRHHGEIPIKTCGGCKRTLRAKKLAIPPEPLFGVGVT